MMRVDSSFDIPAFGPGGYVMPDRVRVTRAARA
jgi:hypothetical protein